LIESQAKGLEMQLEGAVIREQGVTFAVVVVKRHVTSNRGEASQAIQGFGRYFPGMPIVLMSQDASGQATYFGRPDISKFLAGVPQHAIPWKRYTFN
jgi:hypothetical protein